ncbi:hypothetical protein [uncultured Marinobacter sp.]|uniref:alpha/beta hydrolase n=1 Tax=uncultured Marinobacter sp. TaxID=187379 RepID=UPI0030DD46C3
MKIKAAARRLVSVIGNLPYLPGSVLPIDKQAPWSEFRKTNYESPYYFAKSVRAALFPIYAPFREVPHLPYEVPTNHPEQEDDEAWFFLNGICTDRSVLRLNGKALADLFCRRIHLMHNPSDGIVLDLLECAAGRTMQPVSTLDESVAHILADALSRHSKVVLIAHSQGGIIATGAVYKLIERWSGRPELLGKLEIYTFASAATEMNVPQIYCEHFYKTGDYVARIGVAANPGGFSGRHFKASGTGHLMNAHYLSDLAGGQFRSQDDDPASRLVSYFTPPRPAATARTAARARPASPRTRKTSATSD